MLRDAAPVQAHAQKVQNKLLSAMSLTIVWRRRRRFCLGTPMAAWLMFHEGTIQGAILKVLLGGYG